MSYWNTIFIISGFCLGLRAISDQGMVLYPFRKFFEDRWAYFESLPINIAKPIITCCTCMSSIWGSLMWWFMFFVQEIHFAWYCIPIWIMSIITASFINWFGWSLLELIKKY